MITPSEKQILDAAHAVLKDTICTGKPSVTTVSIYQQLGISKKYRSKRTSARIRHTLLKNRWTAINNTVPARYAPPEK